MLVLTRKAEQRIMIGPEESPEAIVITVVSVGGKYVTIGIDAPDSIQVMREELLIDRPRKTANE